LIGLQDQITRYSANFEGMDMNFFPINGAGFSRSIEAIAKKSIRSPTENFDLKFDAREILSVELIKQGKATEVENFQIVDANSIHIDFGKTKIAKGSEIEVQYRYDCSSFDRNETKELAKMIAEIEFRPNSSAFLNEAEASRIIDQVAAFMKKHEDANISLIGVSSFSINPIAWLKILPVEDRPLARAQNLAKSRAATITKALAQKGIEEHRMEAKGAFPGLHRHWYSYLLDASCLDIIPFIDMAGMIQSDRRVVLKVSQGI
jgi:outer membrane protein OmpA-like peptidoglycan-associated protein